VGRLASGPRLVGLIGSEVRVNVIFHIFALRMLYYTEVGYILEDF